MAAVFDFLREKEVSPAKLLAYPAFDFLGGKRVSLAHLLAYPAGLLGLLISGRACWLRYRRHSLSRASLARSRSRRALRAVVVCDHTMRMSRGW